MAARKRRHRSVLPVPTSPVILMKPSPFFTATSSVLSASWCELHAYAKLVSGVIPNGISRSPKWARYTVSTPASRLRRPGGRRVRPPQRPDALARLVEVALPFVVAVHDGRLQQDHDLALGGARVALREQRAHAGHVAQARDL